MRHKKKKKTLKPTRPRKTGWKVAQARGIFKSTLEAKVAEQLKLLGSDVNYEPDKLQYIVPTVTRHYTPDFKLAKDVYVEVKGRLVDVDRKKLILVKEQHPDKTIYLLFDNAKRKLRKGSNTTYAEWAEKNGFKWAAQKVPESWVKKN